MLDVVLPPANAKVETSNQFHQLELPIFDKKLIPATASRNNSVAAEVGTGRHELLPMNPDSDLLLVFFFF
jgi:hypothetical protein